MKLMIASDVHGSAHFGRLLLDALDRERADRLLLLGDLLYHGPRNDLPQGYDPKALTAMLNDARGRLLCVRGNCDAEVDQMVLQFPILADYCVLPCGERLIYATHGHVYNHGDCPPSGGRRSRGIFCCMGTRMSRRGRRSAAGTSISTPAPSPSRRRAVTMDI